MARPPTPDHRIQHGTIRGYHMELRRGNGTCERCKKAKREYDYRQREKRREFRRIMRSLVRQKHGELSPRQKAEADEWMAWIDQYVKANTRSGGSAGGRGS